MTKHGYILGIFLVILPLVTIYLFKRIKYFIAERNYIIMEINRSGRRESRYWKRKLKKLYISMIPVFGVIYLAFRRK